MIPMPRNSTPRPKSNKYHYKTSHTSSRSFTPLAFQPNIKKDSRLKVKKQQNSNLHISETFPFTNIQIRTPFADKKDFNSNKPLDLAQYHKKQSFIMKKKNDLLVARLNDQEKVMQLLKNQLTNLKSFLKQNNELHYKEAAELKTVNQQLRQKYESQVYQIDSLRNEFKSLKNDYSFNKGERAGLHVDNTQDRNQISRRVQYARHYEEILGDIIQEQKCCNTCEKRQRQMQQMRLKYSNELRSLQSYVTFLKEKQLIAEVLEKQVISKNQCIDYLRNHLQIVQTNSNHLLQVIKSLEQRVEQVACDKLTIWDKPTQNRNFSAYKY